MARYHVNPDSGNIGACSAKIQCPFNLTAEEHYPNKASALQAAEALMSEQHNTFEKTVKKYSFVKDFKQRELKFEEDFEGVPTRFFNADLRKNNIKFSADVNLDNVDDVDLKHSVNADPRRLVSGMFQAVSAPADAGVSDSEIVAVGERLGLNLKKIENERYLRALGVEEAWVSQYSYVNALGKTVNTGYVVSPDKKVGQVLARYRMRFIPEDDLPRNFRVIDVRSLMGAARIQRKTGENLLEPFHSSANNSWVSSLDDNGRHQVMKTLLELEEAQLEGKSFKSQQKYIRENSSKSSARVWEDKKYPKDTHIEAASKSPLKRFFKKIEIDNDVDLDEFKRFEKDYVEVVDKLPKIPRGKEPELRIRKLGRHKATGIYFPHKNVVGIDIRTSGSTVHELAHQYDLTVKDNASLRRDFRGIISDYTKSLKIPPGEPASRAEYLGTPTEILARGFTVYAHEKLGINNSLLDERRLEDYDHAPFKDPVLKEKVFQFFNNLYEEDF